MSEPAALRGRSIALIAVAQVAAMALWFSASAVVPALRAEAGIGGLQAALLTSAVQLGFVAGTLASGLLTLPDRIEARRLFALSALVAALANALILAVPPDSASVVALRFATGVCMAGIYPVGMKMMTTWARGGPLGDMGFLVGLLVGALTLGSASPHLLSAFGGAEWRFTLAGASVAAVLAAGLIGLTALGPSRAASPPFDPRHVLKAWTTPSLLLANLGYLGHMWELYAMWAWIGVFLDASFRLVMAPAAAATWAAAAAFAVIGIGAAGCVLGGLFADRLGRTTLTILSMAVSGACCLAVGLLFGGNPVALTLLCLLWGFAIVADSAQFSASVAELSDRSLVGTMLTFQTSQGFLLTLLPIHIVPWIVEAAGWTWAFAFLAAGPAIGVWAMARLRAHPDASKIAGGRR